MEDNKQTWTVVIYGPHYWGCGNSHNEAVENASANGFRKSDNHILFLFSEPVSHVSASEFSISYRWADKEGVALKAEINAKKQKRGAK